MFHTGIDIGSTAAKVVVFQGDDLVYKNILPTGWNSKETSEKILEELTSQGYAREANHITATGYGRNALGEADERITEITCHAQGALKLNGGRDCVVVDIGGQDTKIISIQGGMVADFIMNDKCSAGTGRFIEVMANSMGVTLPELFDLAKAGKPVIISSLCTVFAESEVISLLGSGTPKEDVAKGVLLSVIQKVVTQAARHGSGADLVYLTGGFSNNDFVMKELQSRLKGTVESHPEGRFAGAIGAAAIGRRKSRG